MGYEIRGTVMQSVEVWLEAGETVYTESGGMAWMSEGISMDTNMKGGLLSGLKRMASGESLFLTDYTCTAATGFVVFTPGVMGKVIDLELAEGQSVIMQRNAFMCAQSTVTLEMHTHKRLGTMFFGGEGLFLQKVTGPGVAFCEIDGEVTEYQLQEGQTLKVDPGHVAMFDPGVNFDISRVPGVKNMFLSGEGIFLTTLTGPGRVWLQSMPLSNLATRLIPFLPKSKD
jgi:uncharacterized protein (TIGR00266 family)